MIKRIDTDTYLRISDRFPILDTRTPSEYEKGRIPGAFNVPLFSDAERAEIGTTYKQVGREAAILLGFEKTGTKWRELIERALELAPHKKVCVHCWRGGMRSGAMAWALDLYGFEVLVLEGGYKGFRNWALSQFEKNYSLWVLGGMTGSHKTEVLHELQKMGEQMIDLEGLAQHHGSSYGSMNGLVQPTQQQFENDLAWKLARVDSGRKIWIEDESRMVGKLALPEGIWAQMRIASMIEMQLDPEARVRYLTHEYGALDKDFLIHATERIERRLGPQHAKRAVEAIRSGQMEEFVRIVLVYYDKAYRSGMSKRDPEKVHAIKIDFAGASDTARQVLASSRKIRCLKK